MEIITIQYVDTDTGQILELKTGFDGWKRAYQMIIDISKKKRFKVITIKISDYETDN